MRKWSYKVWAPGFAQQPPQTIEDALNAAADQGWELVGSWGPVWVFRREEMPPAPAETPGQIARHHDD
jgi:hypothetical protein